MGKSIKKTLRGGKTRRNSLKGGKKRRNSLKGGMKRRKSMRGGGGVTYNNIPIYPNKKYKDIGLTVTRYPSLSGLSMLADRPPITGFEVTEVQSQSPAETAGLKVGDIIIQIEHTLVKNLGTAFSDEIQKYMANHVFYLTIRRLE